MALWCQTRPGQQLETAQQRRAHVRTSRCSQTGRAEKVPKRARRRWRTGAVGRCGQERERRSGHGGCDGVRRASRCRQVSGQRALGRPRAEPGSRRGPGPEGSGQPEWWPGTDVRGQTHPVLRGLRDLPSFQLMLPRRTCRHVQACGERLRLPPLRTLFNCWSSTVVSVQADVNVEGLNSQSLAESRSECAPSWVLTVVPLRRARPR